MDVLFQYVWRNNYYLCHPGFLFGQIMHICALALCFFAEFNKHVYRCVASDAFRTSR